MSRPDRRPRDPQDQVEVEVRDLDRIQEKVTFRIEPSHLVLGGVAVLVLLVLVFLAGFWVGRGMRARELERYALVPPVEAATVARPPAPAPVAPEPAAAPRVRGIHGAVLPVEPRSREVAKPVEAPVVEVPPAPAATPVAIPLEAPVATPPAAPVPAAVAAPVAAALAAPAVPAVVVPAAPPVVVPAPPAAVAPGPVATPEPVPVAAPAPAAAPSAPAADGETPWPALAVSRDCRSCALADGECEPEDGPQAEPASAPASGPEAAAQAVLAPVPDPPGKPAKVEKVERRREPAGPTYGVQVRSYRDEEKAKEFAGQLAGKGYKARVVRFSGGPDGEPWYRVRIGRFKTAADAGEFAAKFNERENDKAIPVEER